MLACQLNADDLTEVTIHAVPIVRTTRRTKKFVRTDSGFQVQNDPLFLPLEQLEFSVKVPRGQYVAIGPGVAAGRVTSPGHGFLVHTKTGQSVHT